jgi:hypothetical protein
VVANLVSKRDPKIAIFLNGFPSFVKSFPISSTAFLNAFLLSVRLSDFLNGFPLANYSYLE